MSAGGRRANASREGRIVTHGSTVATKHLRLIAVRVGSGRERTLRRSRARGWLNWGRAWLGLEDRIVAQALALRLLAVSAGRMLFVALVTALADFLRYREVIGVDDESSSLASKLFAHVFA